MTDETEREEEREPIRNVYRKGYFPAVRERWAQAWRTFVRAVRDPGAAFTRFPGWLGEQLRRDRAFFGAIFGFFFGFLSRGLRHPLHRRWILGLFALGGFLATWSWEMCGLTGCPDVGRLAALQPGGAAAVYDVNGDLLADLAPVRWAVVEIDDLPKYVAEAFVAVEDQRFYGHRGVDWRRFIGTTVRNVLPGGRSQGASTITMQVARNVFPDRLPASERTVKRKVLEIRVAREIEREYSKQQILQTYLNNIYFGEGVYGIESASRIYFGKHASDLTLAEAALLAGLPKAPSLYNPRRSMERAVSRRNLVLSLMQAQGRITPERAAAAKDADVRLSRWQPARNRRRKAPYFVEQVKRQLEARFGADLYAGLKVYTTLDPRAQAAAERQLENQLVAIENGAFGRFRGPRRSQFTKGAAETPYLQGGVVLMDARTGDVKALVGGRSWEESAFDRVMQGFRQPGSAFKPVVFAAALSEGYTPISELRDDTLRRELPGGEVWEPRNFDGRFRGEVTLRETARWSINTPTVRLAEQTGLADVRAEARRLGIGTDIPELPSIAIGAAAVRPIELVRAYTPFATLGSRVEPRFVLRVEDARGNTLWEPRPRRRRVLDRGVAFLVTDLLRDVVDRGTGRRVRTAGLTGPAAGKTGTTNGATDAWFVGFTPTLVGAVWIGFDSPRPIVADGSGGELAAPVWARVVRAAQRTTPEPWKEPAGVVERRVTVADRRVIAPGCRARGATYEEHFLRGGVPRAVCPRGTAEEEGGIGGWLDRQAERVGASVGEWLEDAWADAWGWARRQVGLEPAPEGDPAPRPRRDRSPDEGDRKDEAPSDTIDLTPEPEPLPDVDPQVDAETTAVETPPAPRDTVRLAPPPPPPPSPEPAPAAPPGPPDTIRIR